MYWKTPLMNACEYGHEKIAKQLLQNSKIDVNLRAGIFSLKTALIYATENVQLTIVKLLINHKSILINSIGPERKTALFFALEHENYKILEIFLNDSRLDVTKPKFFLCSYPIMRATNFDYKK